MTNDNTILRELLRQGSEILSRDIKIPRLKTIYIGKTLSDLQKRGFVVKHYDGKTNRWSISDLGKDQLKSSEQTLTSLSGSDAPPVTPDHFIFLVSEEKLAKMMSARLGVDIGGEYRSGLEKIVEKQALRIQELEDKLFKISILFDSIK